MARRDPPARARAYWTVAAGHGELRDELLPVLSEGEVLIRTLATGISRGTELLVHRHEVPAGVADVMRGPHQVGELPGPVKYGYLAVGIVEAGPEKLVGQRVFCLHPHQDWFVVPVSAVVSVPADVPTHRAVLTGTVETAVNALWDAGPRIGDRVAVVGAGMVGLSVALLLGRHPLARLEIVETNPARRQLIRQLGLLPADPERAVGDCDLVFHASATQEGLRTALGLLGAEGEVIELSWYGERSPQVDLGAAFHARRLTIRASQVGRIAPSRATRRGFADRLAVALDALSDAAFDRLLSEAAPFERLPDVMAEIANGSRNALCQVITYPDAEE